MAKQELKAKPKAKTKMEFWTPTEKEIQRLSMVVKFF